MVRHTFHKICSFALCAALAGCGADPSAPTGPHGNNGGGGSAGSSGSGPSGGSAGNAGSGGSSGGAANAGAGGSSAGAGGSELGTAGAGGDSNGSAGAAGAGVGGAGAGAGGAPGAGAGGALGMAGAGGAPPVGLACDGAGWLASALISGPGTVDPPANAIDRGTNMNNTRFSTGRPMTVGDWIQVDFGQTLPLDSLSIRWAASDFAATFDVRLSDTPLNHTATANVTGAVGVMGTQTVDIPGGVSGRYLLVTLTSTGGSTHWWSIQDIAVACTPPGGGGGGTGGGGGAGGTGGGGAGGAPAAGAGGAPAAGAGGAPAAGAGGALETGGGGASGGTAGAETGGGGAGGGVNPGGCSAPTDCQDNNPCTDDVCTGGVCSNPPNNAACADDGNACTSNVCSGGVCTHPANDLATCTDGDECTADSCLSGTCTSAPNGSCVCNAAADCTNTNACLDVACVSHQCVTTPNSAPCADDGNPCTDDVCSQGSCGKDKAICVGENTFIIRSNHAQPYQYVTVSPTDGVLTVNGVKPGLPVVVGQPFASVFEKVYLDGTKLKFKIKDVASGKYLGLTAPDRLYANVDSTTAAIFESPACGAAPYVGLYVSSDDDNNRNVTAGGNLFLEASIATCAATSTTSWEKFELIPVAAGCKLDADCNDGNDCTTETCVAGTCTFSNAPSTTACATDGVDCTNDVCASGLCSHQDNGACGTPLITIKTNNGSKYVVLGTDSFLEWTGTVITDGAVFEMVDHVGTAFKLRAQNGLFVTLNDINGTTDELVANAGYVDAVTFDSTACGTKQSLRAVDDVDNNRFVQAPTANPAVTRLRAANATCGTTVTSWEQFEFPPAAP